MTKWWKFCRHFHMQFLKDTLVYWLQVHLVLSPIGNEAVSVRVKIIPNMTQITRLLRVNRWWNSTLCEIRRIFGKLENFKPIFFIFPKTFSKEFPKNFYYWSLYGGFLSCSNHEPYDQLITQYNRACHLTAIAGATILVPFDKVSPHLSMSQSNAICKLPCVEQVRKLIRWSNAIIKNVRRFLECFYLINMP